jgi:hypothetical protein
VIVGVLAIALIAVGFVVRTRTTTDHPLPLSAAAGVAATAEQPVGSPDGSPLEEASGTVQTADQAIEAAMVYASSVGATHPRIVAVDQRIVHDAMVAATHAQETTMGPQAIDLSGFPESELRSTAWLVQMDGDNFGSLTCMAGHTCVSSPTFVVLMDLNGGLIQFNEGVTLPIP